MRYIPLLETSPGDEKWLLKANKLLEKLKKAKTIEERKKIIDANDKVWGELKEWLLSLSHQKCWFSEAKDCFNHWDVEHFRPKKSAKDVDGTEHEGYWWLAFDWKNFRICGDVGNKKKGTYFPLRAGCLRVPPLGDYRLEDPILLDPADPDDPNLISFDFEGKAIPAPEIIDVWEKERVEYSVERYNLNNYPLLVDQRKLVWNECWNLVQQFLAELSEYNNTRSPIAKQQYKERIRSIRSMMRPEKEFSSVARACVMSSGDPRTSGLLRSE